MLYVYTRCYPAGLSLIVSIFQPAVLVRRHGTYSWGAGTSSASSARSVAHLSTCRLGESQGTSRVPRLLARSCRQDASSWPRDRRPAINGVRGSWPWRGHSYSFALLHARIRRLLQGFGTCLVLRFIRGLPATNPLPPLAAVSPFSSLSSLPLASLACKLGHGDACFQDYL